MKSSKPAKPKLKIKKAKAKSVKLIKNKKLVATTEQNCLFCVKFGKCFDKKKSHNYICKLYQPFSAKSTTVELEAPAVIKKAKPSKAKSEDSMDFQMMARQYTELANISPLPPDLKVDDRDIPQAKNFLEFTTSKKFLNISVFAKQLEIGLQTFGEVCMNKKCTNIDYLENVPKKATVDDILAEITPLEWGICPRCGYRKHEMLKDGFKVPHTGVVMAGQRSGKSALTAMVHAYLIHGYLKLQNAPRVMGLLENEILEDTLVALTATKAKELLYSKIEGYLRETPWYKDYHALLDFYGNKYGEELYRVRDTFASYRCRSLLIKASDPDMRKLRGPSRFGGCFTGDTLINTLRGIVPISEVTTKDNVWVNNEIYPVKNVWDNGKKNILKVKFARGQGELNVTKSHVIPVLDINTYKLVEKTVAELKVDDYVLMQMGGQWPTQPYVLKPYTQKMPDYETQLVIDRAWKLKEFTFIDFQDLVGSKNQFYVYTSKLRRAGIIETIFKKQLVVAGEPRSFYRIVKSKQRAEQLLVPQQLTDRRAHVWPTVMTNELARIIGYMVSEGKVFQEKYEFTFPNTNIKLIKDFVRCYIAVFGVAPRVNGPYTNDANSTYWEVRIAYSLVKKFFRHIGFKEGTWSAHKEIPTCILESTKEHVCEFLCAMIDGDGSIGKDIRYHSLSQKLLYQLQAIFRKLKIHTSIRDAVIGSGAVNGLGQLLDCRAGSIKVVGIANQIKTLKYLKNCFKRNRYTGSTKIGRRGRSPVIKHFALPGFHIHDKRLHGGDTNEYIWMTKKYVKPGAYKKHYALKTLEKIEPKRAKAAKKWLYKNYTFVQIKSITNTKTKHQVYDLEIGKLHHYTANNIYVHNSIDELGWFISGKNQNVKFDAAEILESLDNSFVTVRNSYLKLLKDGMDGLLSPMFFNISSPSSKKDLIVSSHDEAKHNPFAISFHFSTWEFNPHLSKKTFDSKFRKDPIKTMRDFGAIPPNSSAPFISDIEHIKGIIAKDRRNTVNFIPQTIISMGGKKMGSGKLIFTGPRDQNKRILAIDPGANHNSFALVAGYFDTNLLIPVFDTFVEIPTNIDLPLNFNDIFTSVIEPMIEHLNIKAMVSDRFQNLKLLHDVEHNFGILAETYSVKYSDFEAVRHDLLDHNLAIPRPEIKKMDEILAIAEKDYPHGFRRSPISHFLHQIVTVQDLRKEVIKGEGLTDDIFRAFVLLYAYLTDIDYRDYCSGLTTTIIKPPFIAGVFAGRRTGVGGGVTAVRAPTTSNGGGLIAIASRG